MRVALTFHIYVGLIISRYEAKVTINEIYASWRSLWQIDRMFIYLLTDKQVLKLFNSMSSTCTKEI